MNDLNDDVFVFARDRFFIGETVEVHMGSEKYVHARLSHLQCLDGFSDISIEKLAILKCSLISFIFHHLKKMVLIPDISFHVCTNIPFLFFQWFNATSFLNFISEKTAKF